jgi:hypothetical protein
MSYEGTILSLHKDCIFVQLDEKAVVFRHGPHNKRTHFTPQNDSARMLLDLLTHNAPDGISFNDLKAHLLRQYQVNDQEAKDALNDFLGDLDGAGLLEKPGGGTQVDDQYYGAPHKKDKGGARGKITAGGSVVTVGFIITWYRG